MPIRFFDLLRPVLESRIEHVLEHDGHTRYQVFQMILEEAERNQIEWYSNRVPNLNYHETACRLAYLYIVAAANANTVKSILDHDASEDLRRYILSLARKRRQLRVCALGAGPGTELMALAKWFEAQQLGFCVQVDFQLLDIVEEWQESWYGLRDEINAHFRQEYGVKFGDWPILPAGNFLMQNVRDTSRMAQLGQIWNHDLYVVNFLLSELFTNDPDFRQFMAAVTARAPRHARFLFIERRGGMWEDRMSAIALESGLELSPFAESRSSNLDDDEDPGLLGDIFTRLANSPFGGRVPRSSWNVVYSVARWQAIKTK